MPDDLEELENQVREALGITDADMQRHERRRLVGLHGECCGEVRHCVRDKDGDPWWVCTVCFEAEPAEPQMSNIQIMRE